MSLRLMRRQLPREFDAAGVHVTHFAIDLVGGPYPYIWVGLTNGTGGGRMLATFWPGRLVKAGERVARWLRWWESRGRR